MIYDVSVIGAGVTGASVARLLSSYNLAVALLEKHEDACFGVSKANSGIIHAGFHHEASTLKAKLEVRGNMMYDRLREELNFPFLRNGVIVAAFTAEEMKSAETLYRRGIENGVPGIELCGPERLLELEPKLNPDTTGGLYAPSGGVIEPYRFVFSLVESAVKNGVDFKTNFEVSKTEFKDGAHTLHSSRGDIVKAKYAVNAAGLHADKISMLFGAEKFKIRGRKGEEYLLDRNTPARPKHVIFPAPAKDSKGMLVIPTVEGTVMIGPTADMTGDKEDFSTSRDNLEKVFKSASMMIRGVSRSDIITSFTGIRPVIDGDDFYIAGSRLAPGLVQAAGIQSPGLTAAPAIAEYVRDLLADAGLKLTERKDYDPCIPPFPRAAEMSMDELDKAAADNRAFANIICRCERVSEAEIVAAIRKGHRTLDGIKFSTRAGMGRCQGGFCSFKILRIIARETGMDITEITKKGGAGHIAKRKISAETIEDSVYA